MLIDWQSQTYENINYAFADKDFMKRGGHAGFSVAAQTWAPEEIAEFVGKRFSVIAKLVQTTLAQIDVWPSKKFSVVSYVDESPLGKIQPIAISVKHSGEDAQSKCAEFIKTIEDQLKSIQFHWRLWSFEF